MEGLCVVLGSKVGEELGEEGEEDGEGVSGGA